MAMMGMSVAGIILWIAFALGLAGGATFDELVAGISWDTILFISGQMIIVTVARTSGMFQYIALRIATSTHGNPKRFFIYILVFVFFISLFFDTTSTMLIIAPLTIDVCRILEVDFKSFLISEAFFANFASIPSIVGDVPNLVIASEAQVNAGFMFVTLMPLSIIYMLVTLPILLRYFDRQLLARHNTERMEELFEIAPESMIHCKRDFAASIAAMGFLVVGFTLGPGLEFQAPMVVFIAASALLLLRKDLVDRHLTQIGWGTIFFLIGLFGLVSAFEITGIIRDLAAAVSDFMTDNAVVAVSLLTWITAGISAVVDNVPISAVLAPIAAEFEFVSPILPLALVVAVNIGGCLLPIASPANVLALAYSEREHSPIGMFAFAKIALPLGFLMMIIGTIWIVMLTVLIPPIL